MEGWMWFALAAVVAYVCFGVYRIRKNWDDHWETDPVDGRPSSFVLGIKFNKWPRKLWLMAISGFVGFMVFLGWSLYFIFWVLLIGLSSFLGLFDRPKRGNGQVPPNLKQGRIREGREL